MTKIRHPRIVQFVRLCFSQKAALLDEHLEGDDFSLTIKLSLQAGVVQMLFYLHTHNPPIVRSDLIPIALFRRKKVCGVRLLRYINYSILRHIEYVSQKISESVDSSCRNGAEVQYESKSCVTHHKYVYLIAQCCLSVFMISKTLII